MNFINFIVLSLFLHESYCFNGCGDSSWIPYKDVKCYKLFATFYLTKEAAESLCNNLISESDDINETYVPTLAEVHSAEEQIILEQYVFNTPNLFEDVWLKASRKSGTTFKWDDQTDVKYPRWETNAPTNEGSGRDCVVMLSGLTRNEAFIHNSNKIENKNYNYSGEESDILDADIEDDRVGVLVTQKDVQTASNLRPGAGLWRDVTCEKRNLVVCQKFQTWSVSKIQTTLMQIRSNLEFEISNKVPIGFIYVQLPNQEAPQVLWPSFTWENVSPGYAGLFFRVEGGGAAEFGQPQSEGGRLLSVQTSTSPEYSGSITIPVDGSPSLPIYGGSNIEGATTYAMSFTASAGEVRPPNTATIVWRRSA